jgi:hypothetical protein
MLEVQPLLFSLFVSLIAITQVLPGLYNIIASRQEIETNSTRTPDSKRILILPNKETIKS